MVYGILDSEENIAPGESSVAPAKGPKKPSLPLYAEAEFLDLTSLDREKQLQAFWNLYNTYSEQEVRRLIRKYPGLPDDAIIDVVYDAFQALWKDVSENGWDERWTWPYLRQTANNLAYKFHQKLVFRSQFVVVPPEIKPDGSGDDTSSDPEAMAQRHPVFEAVDDSEVRLFAENNELMRRVDNAIAEMPPRLQSVGRILAANYERG